MRKATQKKNYCKKINFYSPVVHVVLLTVTNSRYQPQKRMFHLLFDFSIFQFIPCLLLLSRFLMFGNREDVVDVAQSFHYYALE